MKPYPLYIDKDNMVARQPAPGKEIEKINIKDLSEKDLLFRQVMLSQSIRSMLVFFVWIAILEIIGGVVILANILK